MSVIFREVSGGSLKETSPAQLLHLKEGNLWVAREVDKKGLKAITAVAAFTDAEDVEKVGYCLETTMLPLAQYVTNAYGNGCSLR